MRNTTWYRYIVVHVSWIASTIHCRVRSNRTVLASRGHFSSLAMAARLYYVPGDPDYLKVVLLREILGIRESALEPVEGERYLE